MKVYVLKCNDPTCGWISLEGFNEELTCPECGSDQLVWMQTTLDDLTAILMNAFIEGKAKKG